MAPLRRVSLRARLTVLAVTGAVIALGLSSLFLYRNLSDELSAAITDELVIRVDDLAAGFDDSSVDVGSGLVAAQVVDPAGEVVSPPEAQPILMPEELTRARSGQIVVDREVSAVGGQGRVLARPIGDIDRETLIGVAATSTSPLARAHERLVTLLGITGPLAIAVIAAAAWLLTGAALRPVRRMAGEAATISAARAGQRLPQPATEDEIAELGRTLNGMLARIEAAVVHEREFIDNAAHELRTPIAVLRGELELAAQDPSDRPAVELSLASSLEETDRLARLAENLLVLAHAESGEIAGGGSTTELLAAARAAVRRMPHLDEATVEVRGEPALVRGDPEWIGHVIGNLVANAARYAAGRIVVIVTCAADDGVLVVADDGPGFSGEALPRVFDRFIRGDRARGDVGGGAGLGLAIVASVARALDGYTTAGNGEPLGGAYVEVVLPLARTSPMGG